MSPVRDVQGRELDQVRLTGLSARGHHGVLAEERREGQEFRADVVLHLDTRPAAASDALERTVSYATVADAVVAVLVGEPVDLVETLAARIAEVVLAHEGVQAVDVTVHKPQAPLTVPFEDVEVCIRRHRAELPLVPERVLPPENAEAPPRPAPGPPPPPHDLLAERPSAPGPPPPPHDLLAERPSAPTSIALALGANLGDAIGTLRAAVQELQQVDGVEVTGVSPLARTAAVLDEGQDAQPDYLNAVVLGRTSLAPRELLALARRLEDDHGRARTERWGARTLDVDLLAVGDLEVSDPELTLPHPRAHLRAFVLLPWAQADPLAELPGRGRVADLAEDAEDRGTVRWLALDWLTRDPRGTGTLHVGEK